MPSSPRVTLLPSANGSVHADLAAHLEKAGMVLVPPTEDLDVLADEGLPDVLLADWEEEAVAAHPLVAEKRGEIGILTLVPHSLGDVTLPRDATFREIELACALLAEIVRLRREIHRDQGSIRHLRRLANLDEVSKLPNRRAWERELAARFSRPSRTHLTRTLALFDLDDFKSINDTLGHPVGDLVLKEVGRALTQSVRPEDFCARMGGDEFGLLVSGLSEDQSWRLVERVRLEIGEAAARVAGRAVSISAGFACAAPYVGDPKSLYCRADSALLRAKGGGRNQTCQAESS